MYNHIDPSPTELSKCYTQNANLLITVTTTRSAGPQWPNDTDYYMIIWSYYEVFSCSGTHLKVEDFWITQKRVCFGISNTYMILSH